jgi:hypothetical protein
MSIKSINLDKTKQLQTTNKPSLTLDSEVNRLFDPNSYTGKIVSAGGAPALLRYLKTPQTYSIATTAATWGLPSKIFGLKVVLGHHALIRLPGKRIAEWANEDRRSWEGHLHHMTQIEVRTATGKQIEGMWNTHCHLIPKYREWGNLDSAPEGMLHYFPFRNDCFNYADRVLTENGQTPHHLSRLNPTTYAFGPGQNS